MNRSPEINELATALAKAQGEMKAASKSATNPHFKSKYAPLDEVIGVVTAALSKHGLSFLQPTRVDESGVIVETVLLHSSGQWMSETLTMRPQQNTPQGVGGALTYARRYGLSALVGVAADEDDDGNAASKPAEAAKKPEPEPIDEDKSLILADEFRIAMQESQTPADLLKVGTRINDASDARRLTPADKTALKKSYAQRKAELVAQAQPAA